MPRFAQPPTDAPTQADTSDDAHADAPIGTDEDAVESADEPEFELTDVLDLHTFRPRDVADLVDDYIDECAARGFAQVRIIHGKGRGTLRRIVHARLERHRAVASFELGDVTSGGWGATIATLRESER